MKNSIDSLYDRITSKMIRRRRLISVLTVLSIIVSSGVLWGLRDTGITMANDAECGIDEHIHTDECYGDVLICGYDEAGDPDKDEFEYQYVCKCDLEENEEHTHDADCYEFVYAAKQLAFEAEADESDVTSEDGSAEEISEKDTDESDEEDGKNEDVSDTDDAEKPKHVHTADCYARGLICGKEAHDHRYSCYFGEDPEEDEDFGLFDDSKVVLLNNAAADEEIGFFDASEMMVGDSAVKPEIVTDTVDNIAEGIRFTLFDYLDPDDTLDGKNSSGNWNSYDISNGDPDQHPNIAYSGVNTARTPANDILFFAYGTPDFRGETGNYGNYQRRVKNGFGFGNIDPSKNNYSGDYNYLDPLPALPYDMSSQEYIAINNKRSNDQFKEKVDEDYVINRDKYNEAIQLLIDHPDYAAPISGNRPVQGIVNSSLDSGYPIISGSGHSLNYLFDPDLQQYTSTGVDGKEKTVNTSDVREVYKNVNHILQKDPETGHLVFDSDRNYAYYDKSTGNFIVYADTFDIINKDHHKKGQRDLTNDKEYESDKLPGFKIGFFPFNDYNSANVDPNFDTETEKYNHHFGMTMDAKFINAENHTGDSKNDVVFSYSGDDDMWVFVDGELVLDVGGIHEPTAGMIDFTNGLVWVQDNAYGKSNAEIEKQIKGYGIDFDKIQKPRKYGVNTNVTEETKWVVTQKNFEKNKEYEIKMFYLERGGCYSNLAMDINLPTIKSLVVEKEVDKNGGFESDYNNTKYTYQVWELDSDGRYNLATDIMGGVNSFELSAGERRVFENIAGNRNIKVVEAGVDPSVYSEVKISENTISKKDITLYEGYSSYNVESGVNLIHDVQVYRFTNVIRAEKASITVEKKWIYANGNTSPPVDNIKFKLYRKDVTHNNTTKMVVYNNKRTFSLDNNNGWKMTFDLPERYGSHKYEYSVEEMIVPNGYSVSYGTNEENGNLMIINTDVSKTDIYVKKEWENISPDKAPPVEVTLTRQYVEYEESTPAVLDIKVKDHRGNILGSAYFGSESEKKVYVGGDVDFRLTVPDGVEITEANVTAEGLNYEIQEDGFIRLYNLSENSKITITVENDSWMLAHHSFSGHTCDWEARGDVSRFTSNTNSYALEDALKVTGRTVSWHGLQLNGDKLAGYGLSSGKQYTFSVYVYCPGQNGINFTLGFNNPAANTDAEKYLAIATADSVSGQWVQLSGSYYIPSSVNLNNSNIYIQPTSNANVEFYIDEFVIVEGRRIISVEPGTGIVSVENNTEPVYHDNSSNIEKNGQLDNRGWTAKDDCVVSVKPTNEWGNEEPFIFADQRKNHNYAGAQKSLPLLVPGDRYNIYLRGQMNTDEKDHIYIKTTLFDSVNFKEVNGSKPVSYYDTFEFEGEVEIPGNADTSRISVYVENRDAGTPLYSYRIYEFKAAPLAFDGSETKEGYTFSNGRYTAKGVYILSVDTDSVTNPVNVTGTYLPDQNWSRKETLNSGNSWSHHWTKSDLDENSNRLYIYTIEEKDLNRTEFDVIYRNNSVKTNTENNPIIVRNKYKWYILPATGGRGTTICFIGGIAFILLGITGAVIINRRKSKNT